MNPSGQQGVMASSLSNYPYNINKVATHRQYLEEKKSILEAELSRVNAALEALDKHPEIEAVMTLVQQAM